MNTEKTIFRIPWKHAGKFSWREEDCLIFKVSLQGTSWTINYGSKNVHPCSPGLRLMIFQGTAAPKPEITQSQETNRFISLRIVLKSPTQ